VEKEKVYVEKKNRKDILSLFLSVEVLQRERKRQMTVCVDWCMSVSGLFG
jgi:hypothetical protein